MDIVKELLNIILEPAFVTLISGVIIAVTTWYLNESGKRRHDNYIRREESYKNLLSNLEGFYENSANKQQKAEFLRQLTLCWLYCPDDVIKKGYMFLSKVKTGQKFSDEEKEKAFKEFILAIRKDLKKRTKLNAGDFQILVSS